MRFLPSFVAAATLVVTQAGVEKSKKSKKRNPCKGAMDRDSCYAKRCLGAYEDSGYTRLATSDYGKWFNEDSVLEYAAAGLYKGEEGIAEYVNFFVTTPSIFKSTTKVATASTQLVSAEKNKCIVLVADQEKQVLNKDGIPALVIPPLTNGATVDYIAGQKIVFEVRGDNDEEILIKQIDIYLPRGFGAVSIAQANLMNFAGFFCEGVMFNSCPDIWETNFGAIPYPTDPNQNPCIGTLVTLPPYEPANDPSISSIAGNSIGCRLMHGSFAATGNSFHCPHISFTPIADDNGDIKCQQTQLKTVDDFFTEDELTYMYDAANDFGLLGEEVPGIRVTN